MTILPKSLLGRTALVLIAALVLSLAAALAVFVGNRVETLSALGGRNAAERVAGLVGFLEETPTEMRRAVLRRFDTPGMRAGWGIQPLVQDREQAEGVAHAVIHILSGSLSDREIRASTAPPPPPPETFDGSEPRGMHSGRMGGGFGIGHGPLGPALRISVRLNDGSWLNVLSPIDAGEPLWKLRFIGPLLAALLLVSAAALLAVRRAVRPLALLAEAARRLGMDFNAQPLAERGPSEVRAAARAFNVMQGRIRRFVEDRTLMLAAISHDLRTPLTRMRLRAEFVEDDEQRTKMLADLEEMESMIASTLAFARDDSAREDSVLTDVAAMVRTLAQDFNALYDGPEQAMITIKAAAVKRAVANILDNACKYGGGARIAIRMDCEFLSIIVDDDGPGIPADQMERVFAPFVRLETSRSRDTGGVGLGMAGARAAMRAHGGNAELSNRPEGGLRVIMTIPVT